MRTRTITRHSAILLALLIGGCVMSDEGRPTPDATEAPAPSRHATARYALEPVCPTPQTLRLGDPVVIDGVADGPGRVALSFTHEDEVAPLHLGETTADAEGVWQYTLPDDIVLDEGRTAVTVDQLMQDYSCTTVLTIEDGALPMQGAQCPPKQIETTNTLPRIESQGPVGATVRVTVGEQSLEFPIRPPAGMPDAVEGFWVFQASEPLSLGEHELKIVMTFEGVEVGRCESTILVSPEPRRTRRCAVTPPASPSPAPLTILLLGALGVAVRARRSTTHRSTS